MKDKGNVWGTGKADESGDVMSMPDAGSEERTPAKQHKNGADVSGDVASRPGSK